MKKICVLGVIYGCLFSMLYTTSSSALEANYTLVDLGTLGGAQSIGYDINDSGQVVGISQHAFLYDGSTMQDLGTLGGAVSSANSINNSSQVTGGSQITIGSNISHAFVYEGSTMQDLGTLGGARSTGYCINDSGQVVGESEIAIGSTISHAFLYDGSTMRDLGTLGGDHSFAGWINTHGQVVGASYDVSGNWRAFLYDGITMQDLGTLGGARSFAYRINDSGQIVGESEIAIGSTSSHAFLYDGGNMRDLGTLQDDDFGSWAADVNASGQVVGGSRNSSLNWRAFLYDGSSMLDLCSVTNCVSAGWDYLAEANAINDNGDITGYGSINGEIHAFLALASHGAPTPVYSCVGGSFEPPFDEIITLKNKVMRAIPVKMSLVDTDGSLIADSDISSPPVVNVSYTPVAGADYSSNHDLVPPGLADEGNEFRFEYPYWVFNLSTKQFTSAGTYEVIAIAGDDSYFIDASSCSGTFVRLP